MQPLLLLSEKFFKRLSSYLKKAMLVVVRDLWAAKFHKSDVPLRIIGFSRLLKSSGSHQALGLFKIECSHIFCPSVAVL
jgi:hypothetical protein